MPAPPHSDGTATPPRPSSKAFFTASAGYLCSRSQRLALGVSSLAAKSRQVSRSSLCSSLSSISMVRISRGRKSGERAYTHLRRRPRAYITRPMPRCARPHAVVRKCAGSGLLLIGVLGRIFYEIWLALVAAERVDAALVRFELGFLSDLEDVAGNRAL